MIRRPKDQDRRLERGPQRGCRVGDPERRLSAPGTQARFQSAHYTALAACLIAGVALWFTRGTLDVFGDEHGATRVAMLPSGPELAGLMMLVLIAGAGAAAALAWCVRPGDSSEAAARQGRSRWSWPPVIFQVSLPLFTLLALSLPYLPWLPDRWRALRSLTGPVTQLVWFIVLAQVAWVAWSVGSDLRRATRPREGAYTPKFWSPSVPRFSRPLPAVWLAAIFLLSLGAFGSVAARLADSDLFPGGDEPHYLILMQSLWRDHDLKIENNYARADYAEYLHAPLLPDYRTRGTDGQIYSIHPIGLPLLAAPIYGVAGYRGVVWFLVLLAALTAALMWRWTQVHSGSPEAASFAWASICLGVPFLLNSFVVYPEIPAAFCVMVAVAWRPAASGRDPHAADYFPRALAISALPWLSTKYAPMAAALVIILAWRARARPRALVALLLPFFASLCLWLGFFYRIWGSPWPTAPYGPDRQTTLATFRDGGLGLLFDQHYGVLLFAPALAIGIVGLARMWRSRDHASSTHAIELTLVGAALLGTVGTLGIWWGGSSAPGRSLVPGLPLLGLPIAWQYRRSAEAPVSRAAYQLLLLIGVAISGVLLFAENGLLVAPDRSGPSSWLGWLSPSWQLWTLVPAFVDHSALRAAGHAALWTTVALVVGWMCGRSKMRAPGAATLVATTYMAGAVLAMSLVTPLLSGNGSQPDINPAARSHAAMLDAFDATAHPLAIVYNPLSLVRPETIPPRMILMASPELRYGPQPLRVFLNARFALPAGEYEVEIGGLPSADSGAVPQPVSGTIGLQVGRMGSPLYEWEATIRPGGTWRRIFTLPVDAEFVGFRTSPSLAPATRLWLRPRHIVDLTQRVTGLPVLSAAAYGSTSVFFRDDGVYTERTGFWLRGRSAVNVTVMKADTSGDSLTFKLHSGAKPNTVTLEMPQWREQIDLTPNVPREVRIPARVRPGPTTLRITTSEGFVPAELSTNSTDRRLLGCWVEVVGG